ncbi:MAG: metal-dependent transcriptional regulator [Candidatus Helarchaeota archaeon]
MSELRHDLEEILEYIWMLTKDIDKKSTTIGELHQKIYDSKKFSEEKTKSLVNELNSLNFIKVKDDRIEFSKKGYERARQIIRCHRLYERLFSEVLRIADDAKLEKEACVLEHIIASDVEESVCTLLGHPKTCPHGFKIPPGPCCKKKLSTISSIIVPVTELDIGESGTISYITSQSNREMDKLLAFGILPGNPIKLHQKMPLNGPIVLQIDQTQVALEKSVAEHIYVRRIKKNND